jgi:cytochrome P450
MTTIPSVPRTRCFADSRDMALNPAKVLQRYIADYGTTFKIYLGGLKEAIVTIDPAVIQHVLKTNPDNYHKSEIQVKRMGHFLGKGLLTTEGEAWRNQRKLIQTGFSPKQLGALTAIMQDSLDESLAKFDAAIQQGPVDVYTHFMKMTFAMVARSLFGAYLPDGEIEQVSHTICTVQEFIVRQTLQPYLNPWFAVSGELKKHDAMRSDADAVLMRYIKARRNAAPGNDLLQNLMDARYADGEGMPDELILSESMQLLVAGHETSSNGLSWLLYLLSTNPDALARVRDEFDAVLDGGPLTYADVMKFEYTGQVIHEALRLYPPFWMIDRMAVADDQVAGYIIPAGSMVIVYVYGAHHSAPNWPDPERFNPERFTRDEIKSRAPFTFLPFGGGPRICIGNQYAMLQILMILSELLRRYEFQLVPDQEIEARPMVILRQKNGIRMNFTPATVRDRDPVAAHIG